MVALAAFLRFYKLEYRTGFEADAEEIALKSTEILKGDLALLGPKTSVGGFSIGPLFSYLWAISSFLFKGNPVAGAYTAAVIGLVGVVAVYVAGKIFFSNKAAFIIAFIWSVAMSIVLNDQISWAPVLLLPSVIILLLGAYIAIKKSIGLPIAAFGAILGFQAHFGIFLSVLAVFIFWLFYRPKINKKNIFTSLSVVVLGLSPNIVFDLTHNFVNFKRLFLVFSHNPTGTSADFNKIFFTASNYNISLLIPYPSKMVANILFSLIMLIGIFFFVRDKKGRPLLLLFLLSIILPIITFLFYKSNFTEYYLVMIIPPFLFLLGYLIAKLFEIKFGAIVILLLVVIGFNQIKSNIFYKRAMSLGDKKDAVAFIIKNGGKTGYGVSLSTEAGWDHGYTYIFSYYGASPNIPPKKGETKIFTIVIPSGYKGIMAKKDFNGIGVLWEGIEVKSN